MQITCKVTTPEEKTIVINSLIQMGYSCNLASKVDMTYPYIYAGGAMIQPVRIARTGHKIVPIEEFIKKKRLHNGCN